MRTRHGRIQARGAREDRAGLQRRRRCDSGGADRAVSHLAGGARAGGGYLDWLSLGGRAVSCRPDPAGHVPQSRPKRVGRGDRGYPLLGAKHRWQKFQVFAVNCAHLGCPVRWFPQSSLFMCPCHGGVYYRDGSRASGPSAARAVRVPLQGRTTESSSFKAGETPTTGSPTAL